MALKDLQRRTMQSGRIRLGVKVPTGRNGKSRPEKLSTFRFTSGSQHSIEAIAALFGGEARPWADAPTPGQWEVVTEATSIPVAVPPGDAAVSQWYEMWGGGGCLRRCDSQLEQISGGNCLCPADQADRDDLAARNPPAACKPVTRLSLIIPDAPGLGTWRLDSHGWNAAHELGGVAEFLAAVRERGVIVPARLRLEQRKTVRDGKTSRYVVPMLEVIATLRELTTMTAGDIRTSLPPAPVTARAITAAAAPAVEAAPVAAAPKAWAADPAPVDEVPVDDAPPVVVVTPPEGIPVPASPEEVVAAARAAAADPERLRALWRFAQQKVWLDEFVPESDQPDAPYSTVKDVIEGFAAKVKPKQRTAS